MKKYVKYGGAGLQGIPPAPPVQKAFNRADQWFDDMKVLLANRLPFLTPEEVNVKSKAYHEFRVHELLVTGYQLAAHEFSTILKKELKERKEGKYKHLMMGTEALIQQQPKVKFLIDMLCRCQDFVEQYNFGSSTLLRKEIGEKFLKSGDIWLAKHFFFSALQNSRKMAKADREKEHFQAEIHCLLAFIARESSENFEIVLDNAINHLVVCRQLAKGQPWQFKPSVLTIRLKKPITLHGLRNDFAIIDGCSMSLYMIATLLEHEILIGLASQILKPIGHHHVHNYIPTEAELKRAHKYATHALKLAYEVRQTDALLSALMRFAVVLRHGGQVDEATSYFQQMIHQAELTGNYEAYAIALQNIAHCQLGKHEAVKALESLAKEKETCEKHKLEDLEADTLKQFGHLLLLEGHLWEAEECYSSAYVQAVVAEEHNRPHHSHLENTFVMWAIGAGQKIWSRFSCLARSDEYKNLIGLMEWKNRRAPLPPVYLHAQDYHLDRINEIYVPFVPPTEEEILYAEKRASSMDSTLGRTASAFMSSTSFGRSKSTATTTNKPSEWPSTMVEAPSTIGAEADEDVSEDFIFATDRAQIGLEAYNRQLRKSQMKKQSTVVRRITAARQQKESIKLMLDDAKRKFSRFRKSVNLELIAPGDDGENPDGSHHDFLTGN